MNCSGTAASGKWPRYSKQQVASGKQQVTSGKQAAKNQQEVSRKQTANSKQAASGRVVPVDENATKNFLSTSKVFNILSSKQCNE